MRPPRADDFSDHSWKLGHEIKEFPNDSDPTPIASVHLVERDGTILMHAVYLNQGVRWSIAAADLILLLIPSLGYGIYLPHPGKSQNSPSSKTRIGSPQLCI